MPPLESKSSNANPPIESKTAKKKKAKAEVAQSQPPPASTESEVGARRDSADGAVNGADGTYESPYIKELQKNIRNIKKKLNATQKVDSIIAENPNVSLDDLIIQKKINQDQKAQAEKKPSLKASLTQFEEQIKQYQQFDEDHQKRAATERSTLESAHKDELQKVKDAVMAGAAATSKQESKDNLLVLSKFLRAAAAKRQGGDENSAENRAFEGALLLVYGGEAGAVVAMESLISGSEEKVPTVDQTPSEYTYKQVRDLAFEYAPYAAEEAWAEDVAKSEPVPPTAEDSSAAMSTDPTVIHAGLTELNGPGSVVPAEANNQTEAPEVPNASTIDAGAANSAGANNWDPKASMSADSGAEGWVEVPRDPTETDSGTQATPAATHGTQSWADEVQADPTQAMPEPEYTKPPANGDGFSEVHRNRGGRGRGGQGEQRGRGRGGGFRGDRGDGGGRGRNGYRNDRRGGGEGGERGRGRGGYRGDRGGNRGRGDGQQAL